MDCVSFNVCPQQQFIADSKGDWEAIYFTPVNHGICRNGCGGTHLQFGATNKQGEALLIDGDLDFLENCPLVQCPIGESQKPWGQGNEATFQFKLCPNGCGMVKKEISKMHLHDCTGVVVRGFELPRPDPPVNVPFQGVPVVSTSRDEESKPWVQMLLESARLTRNGLLQKKRWPLH